jgi:hypothetical protein
MSLYNAGLAIIISNKIQCSGKVFLFLKFNSLEESGALGWRDRLK